MQPGASCGSCRWEANGSWTTTQNWACRPPRGQKPQPRVWSLIQLGNHIPQSVSGKRARFIYSEKMMIKKSRKPVVWFLHRHLFTLMWGLKKNQGTRKTLSTAHSYPNQPFPLSLSLRLQLRSNLWLSGWPGLILGGGCGDQSTGLGNKSWVWVLSLPPLSNWVALGKWAV